MARKETAALMVSAVVMLVGIVYPFGLDAYAAVAAEM